MFIFKKKKAAKKQQESRLVYLIIASILLFFSIFSIFSFFGLAGKIGEVFNTIVIVPLLNYSLFILVASFLFLSYKIFFQSDILSNWRMYIGFPLLVLFGSAFLSATFGDSVGGFLGQTILSYLNYFFGFLATFILLIILVCSLWILKVFSPIKIYKKIFEENEKDDEYDTEYYDEEDEDEEDEEEDDDEEEEYDDEEDEDEYEEGEEDEEEEEYEDDEEEYEDEEEEEIKQSNKKVIKYKVPPITLLNETKGKAMAGDTRTKANMLKKAFNDFNIDINIEEVTVGPTFTRYSIKPAEGVRLQKIVSLQNNLELVLAAHPIRIEAPIPGKPLVGIEVPNSTKATIGLKGLLKSPDYKNYKDNLAIAIGKTINGHCFVSSLEKMPHLLVAGTTGSGKSVLIHNIILSLLFRYSPKELRFIFIDPKRVELTMYAGIPHLYTETITSPKQALKALVWATNEMERRYSVLEEKGSRDINSYNKQIGKNGETMSKIVIVIDELADLMQSYPREIEGAIVRIAQKARAVGIHLVLSTQRPSVNIITGVVKANIPVRISLQVASAVDSRTILDTGGAETLVGSGDLLYISSEYKKPLRAQSAFITEQEVKKIVSFLRKNNTPQTDFINLELKQKDTGVGVSSSFSNDEEELYEEAKEIVITSKKASTSLLQRKLKIGYSKAARLIDLLEEQGVVGPAIGNKPREILEEE